jgi:acetyl-CoA carboxylase biotin carboxyl carrier protein
MAGSVFQILVAVGDSVSEADELVILESMKMEIPIEAPAAGTVGSIAVEVGQSVQEGDRLLTLE